MINRDTQLCMSLAGRPGNFGTRFHNYLYEKLGLNYIYKAFTTQDIAAAVKGVRALGIRGCAVSMPFKESCIPFLDALDPSAKAIDSVNTIVNDDGRLTGLNTDYIAVKSLIDSHQLDSSAKVMIQGSGGMGKAVIAAFRDAGFRDVIIAARHRDRGLVLAKQYGFNGSQSRKGSRRIFWLTSRRSAWRAVRKAKPWPLARRWWNGPTWYLTWSLCRRKPRSSNWRRSGTNTLSAARR